LASAARNERCPIVFVTAVGQERNIVRGLQLGADDYIVKPFSTKELLARIEVPCRRGREPTELPQHYANRWLSVDMETRQVKVDGQVIELSPIEFRLLTTLIRNEGKVFHQFLLEQVMVPRKDERHYLKLYIWYCDRSSKRIRTTPAVLTERGVGYWLARAGELKFESV
jgi:two-component system KDP operon response regulator KdpE